MFEKILIENQVKNYEIVKNIQQRLSVESEWIDSYQDYFSKVRKPYLHKRKRLNLFLAKREKGFIKTAPDAYGKEGGEHYYFSHSFNCIFECEYCYLQDSFRSPDIVLFVNHHDYLDAIEEKLVCGSSDNAIWMHAGEYSDSLALSGLTREWQQYFDLFSKYPHSRLELRTKSASLQYLKKCKPNKQTVLSFSISPHEIASSVDRKTPPVASRLKAMRTLKNLGFSVAIHLDPVVYHDRLAELYRELASQVYEQVGVGVEYVSVGVVRFPSHLYREVARNYPDSIIHTQPFLKSKDGMRRYPKVLRNRMLKSVRDAFLNQGFPESIMYDCMED